MAVLAGACASQQAAAPPKTPAAAATLAKAADVVPEGPPVTLLPAATARPLELAAISITSVDRVLTSGATLAGRAVPLPVDPAGLRDMLLTQAGLSPEIAANLDLGAPSGAAVMAMGHSGATGLVMAVAARGPAEAERVIGALGKKIMKRGAVVLIDNGSGGRGWVFRAGNVVVLSDEIDALARGAMLALEARHAAPEDVTAVLYPEAIARANGTDVKSAVAAVMAAVRSAREAQAAEAAAKASAAAAKPGKGKGTDKDKDKAKGKQAAKASPVSPAAAAAADDHALEMMTEVLALVADAETVDVGLMIDNNRGVSVRARLHARPGSGLAGVARDARAFELDTAVLAGGGAPALVAASSYGPFIRAMMQRQRDRLQASKDKGATAALAFFDAMLAALAGQTSMAFTMAHEAPHFSGELSYPLKDEATAAKLGAALGKLDRTAALALWNAQVGATSMFDFTVKKESVGKVKALRYVLSIRKDAAVDQAAMQNLFGRSFDTYLAVVGTRLIATMGRDAKTRLGALAAGKAPAPPQGALADALAAATKRDGFFYMDFAPVLALMGTYSQDPRAALLARGTTAAIPIYGTAGGDGAGKLWSLDFTIPPAAFTGAGTIIQSLGAASTGGPK